MLVYNGKFSPTTVYNMFNDMSQYVTCTSALSDIRLIEFHVSLTSAGASVPLMATIIILYLS